MGEDEIEIEASFCEAIRIARAQKSISLGKRAEGTYAEYQRRKAIVSAGSGFPITSLVTFSQFPVFRSTPTHDILCRSTPSYPRTMRVEETQPVPLLARHSPFSDWSKGNPLAYSLRSNVGLRTWHCFSTIITRTGPSTRKKLFEFFYGPDP
jgi:hypothetical protein